MMNLTEYQASPQTLADYLPWACLIAPGVILNKDGSFQRTAEFRGPDLDSSTSEGSSTHKLIMQEVPHTLPQNPKQTGKGDVTGDNHACHVQAAHTHVIHTACHILPYMRTDSRPRNTRALVALSPNTQQPAKCTDVSFVSRSSSSCPCQSLFTRL